MEFEIEIGPEQPLDGFSLLNSSLIFSLVYGIRMLGFVQALHLRLYPFRPRFKKNTQRINIFIIINTPSITHHHEQSFDKGDPIQIGATGRELRWQKLSCASFRSWSIFRVSGIDNWSRISHADSTARWFDYKIWNLGHSRTGTIQIPCSHVL